MSAYSDKIIADGATAYWRLGETSGTTANDSVGTAHGTISGGVTLGQAGALADGDKAMAFDGTTCRIAVTSVLVPAAFSLEAWIKYTPASAGAHQTIVSNRGVSGGTDTVYAGTVSSKAVIYFGGSTHPGVKLIDDDMFHHIVFVTNGSQITIYVDGAVDAGPTATSHIAGTYPLDISYDTTGSGLWWKGTIDEVAIYPTALTPTQIAAHYAAKDWTAKLPAKLQYRWCRFTRRPFRQRVRA